MCDAPVASKHKRAIAPPQWGQLYGLLSCPLAFLGANELLFAPSALRSAFRVVLSLAVFTAMAWWVRLNRAALEARDWCECATEKTTVRVIPSCRPSRWTGNFPDEFQAPPPAWSEEDEAEPVTGGVA